MGYRRSFTRRIAISYSGSVSYPASQSGGSVSYSGTAYEDVTVNIDVATDPFEHSVARCNTHVGTLTGAVVATEAAQIASIRDNARKVGRTIVDGFFKTVRSEITQQISELSSRINATLLHLRELAKRCVDKQRQMETDYNRISTRYLRIFEELNGELKNRIFELNRPAFIFKAESDENATRIVGGSQAAPALVAGRESSSLQALISASRSKKQVESMIREIDAFLMTQKRLDRVLQQCMLSESRETPIYIPVCYLETSAADGSIDRRSFQPDRASEIPRQSLEDSFAGKSWRDLPSPQAEHIRRFFNREVSDRYAAANPHEVRVKEYIARLFDVATIKSL